MKKDSVAVSKEIIMFDVASMACQQSKKKCCLKRGLMTRRAIEKEN